MEEKQPDIIIENDKKKPIIPIVCAVILLIGIIAIGIGFTKNDKKELKDDTTKTKETTTTKNTDKVEVSPVLLTVILEINPKLALELNDQEVVVNMYPLNDDAKSLKRESYIGKTLEDSIEKVMDDTKSYIDKNKKITVSVNRGETSFTDSKVLSIKSKVVDTIKKENEIIEVKEKELTPTEITEVIENIKNIKVEDKKPENQTTTTTTTTTSTTTTSTTAKKTTTSKPTSKKTIKADYNLNDNIKILITEGDLVGTFIYPNKEECKGKFYTEITIPEGQTYDSYCENKVPSQPVLKGKGYYCAPSTDGMIEEPGVTTSKTYACEWINSIVSESTVKKAVENVVKKSNAVELGGGRGGANEITLDEAACKKYSLTCGRW